MLQTLQAESLDGEDDSSIQLHIQAIQQEMNKSVPNMAIVDDRMARTLQPRRQDVTQLPLLDILKKYPAFQLDSQVSCMGWYCKGKGLGIYRALLTVVGNRLN